MEPESVTLDVETLKVRFRLITGEITPRFILSERLIYGWKQPRSRWGRVLRNKCASIMILVFHQ